MASSGESRGETQTAAQRQVLEGRPHASFRLVVVAGPDKGKVFPVPPVGAARVLIGQSEACEMRLTDRLVSRRHAGLELRGPMLEITDLGSRNGTFANEVSITQACLWGGEVLRLGGTTMHVELDDGVVEARISDATSFGRIVGASEEMRRLYPFFEQLAQSGLPLIIEGETGTGKELLAETLHETGPRASGPFVVFDAAQVPAANVESVLFGDEGRAGIFEQADGGTLLIDEVGELDANVQKKLLRVLERGEVQRAGTTSSRTIDVRVIATTRLDLDQLVQDGAFREDLYYRLLVSRVELPPLQKRKGDIAVLARHFWQTLGGKGELDATTLAQLGRHGWPGNVRELRNRVARMCAFGHDEPYSKERGVRPSVPPSVPPAPPASEAADVDQLFERVLAMDLPLTRAREHVVAEFERVYVERVLAAHGGNVGRAAAASGLARRYFQILRAKRSAKP
jgi:DNA-binding NtrC family response regulator